jgi:hypothetical protein
MKIARSSRPITKIGIDSKVKIHPTNHQDGHDDGTVKISPQIGSPRGKDSIFWIRSGPDISGSLRWRLAGTSLSFSEPSFRRRDRLLIGEPLSHRNAAKPDLHVARAQTRLPRLGRRPRIVDAVVSPLDGLVGWNKLAVPIRQLALRPGRRLDRSLLRLRSRV